MSDNPVFTENGLSNALSGRLIFQNLSKENSFILPRLRGRMRCFYFLFLDRFSDGLESGGFASLDGMPVEGNDSGRTTLLFHRRPMPEQLTDAWFGSGKKLVRRNYCRHEG